MGSDYKKPDAVTIISRENYRQLVFPLSVNSMIFVGKKTAEELERYGIRTIGELAATDVSFLISLFGKNGEYIHACATGEDKSPVSRYEPEKEMPKSVGNGMTFRHDLTSAEEIRVGLLALAEEIATRLRKRGLYCRTLAVTVKGNDLRQVSRQTSMDPPTNLYREMTETAFSLVQAVWHSGKPIRALTVTASHLLTEAEFTEQLSYFDQGEEKREKVGKLESTMDEIRRRYGYDAVKSGAVLDTDIGITPSGSDEKGLKEK